MCKDVILWQKWAIPSTVRIRVNVDMIEELTTENTILRQTMPAEMQQKGMQWFVIGKV